MHDDAHVTMTQKRKRTNNSNIRDFSGSLQMVVQIITVFHNRWIDYYYLVGEIDIYNTNAKGRKTK
jgi:hypothetical protein